ncbi:hypothetical protein PFISCL1PPCAC_5796, partial [Pristionchus fissidentatus]
VALRNVLFDVVKRQAKLGDFGMARRGTTYVLKAKERIPIFWAAPELLQSHIHSPPAGVYAYGVFLKELCSPEKPVYEGITNEKVKEQVTSGNLRPRFVEGAPAVLVEIASLCFNQCPTDRPPMIQILRNYLKRRDASARNEAVSRVYGRWSADQEL